ncbi:HdeD family acid-resistance protein [Leucobacter soli]|uniref:HdeD family acid-resistance protein n=1 Tax=Leucobacter soli TaxID=2812850 RepID=UPI00360FB5B5
MTDTASESPAKGARLALLVGGLAAVGFGVAVLVWPTKTAVALTGVIAVYAVVAGIVYAALGLFSKGIGAGGRIGHVLLGVLYVVAGVYAFGSLKQSAVFLALFLTIMVGVMWVVEGFTSLFTLGQSGSKALTITFAILSVIAGFTLLSSPSGVRYSCGGSSESRWWCSAG